jgi:hypothetical protein
MAEPVMTVAGDRRCPYSQSLPDTRTSFDGSRRQQPDHAGLVRRRSSDASFLTAVLLAAVEPPQPGYLTDCDAAAAPVDRLTHRQALVVGHGPQHLPST